MRMKKVLLDTNAYSRLAGGEEALVDVLCDADVVFVSVFVLGELFAGFKGGKHEKKNRERLGAFLERPTVKLLMVTDETAEVFGTVKERLRRSGTSIPINDVWIAAHALESGATLVTYDAHFQKVDGLLCWP